jgi:hypothetical protein
MKNQKKQWLLGTVAAALTSLAFATPHASASIIFATFSEPGTSQGFTFKNNTSSGSISASTPVDFEFTAASGLPTTVHNATLTISGPPLVAPASSFGALLDEPVGGPQVLTIIDNGTSANLLTMVFTGDLAGFNTAPSASLIGADTTANTVTYTSAFLTFSGPGNSYNLGLADLSVPLTLGPGGFLNTFLANIDGQFTGGNVSGGGSPEPASLGILALGAVALLNRRRNA